MTTNNPINIEKIEKLLFDSEHISTMAIAKATDINYQTIYKYRTNQLRIEHMRLIFAVRLCAFYDECYPKEVVMA